jgi:ADP-ribose pyrophosphatase YjhB (NUDIX family)
MTEPSRQRGRILLGSGAIVVHPRGDRVLMVRHRDMEGDFWRGKWIFPGGLVELGETLAEAAAREVLEETGVRVELGPSIPPHDRVVRGRDGRVELHVVYNVLWARALGEELAPGDDVAEAAWFGASDIRARRQEVHEDTWHLIEHAGLADTLEEGVLELPECVMMLGPRGAR